MSSHHIIREKQEPALLVLGLDGFPDDLLGQLLEWSPTLLVTPDAAERVNAYGIKFDVLIGGDVLDDLQEDIKHISRESGTIIQAALKYLVTNGYPAVNVVADDLELDEYLTYADQLNIVLFSMGKKIYPVTNGFAKWKPAGEMVEIVSSVDEVDTTGLESMGNGLYRTMNDGFFTIRFDMPMIFIAEAIA